jgi:Ca-activated chloride channel family protein
MKDIKRSGRMLRLMVLPWFLLTFAIGGPVREKTAEGNRQYGEAKYDQALTSYVEARSHAEDDAEDRARLHFNIGDALYKQKKHEEARKEFEKSLLGNDPDLQEKSHYNIGNTWFEQAMQTKDFEMLKQAAASYRKTLELDPEDQDAKYNLEVVRRHIDLQQKKQSPKPERKKSQDDKKDQQKKESQDQQQEQEDQQKQQQQQQQAPAEKDQSQEQKQEEKQAQQGATAEQEFSKKEAERILDAMQQKEKEQMKESYRARMQTRPGQDKDW